MSVLTFSGQDVRRLPDNKHRTPHRSVDRTNTSSSSGSCALSSIYLVRREFLGKTPVNYVFQPFS